MKNSQITVPEWRWAAGWSLAVLFLSCVPYLIAAVTAPEGWQFAGILVNPYDGHSYLAKIRQGLAGNWLFHLTYTPEPHEGAFIFTFYLALGHLAALLHLSPVVIFHLARLVSGLCLLLVAFRFIAWVTPQPQERRLAFVLLLSSSGLGWLGAIFGAFPIDLWVPEAFVPYSLYANPHFPLAMLLMLIIFKQIIHHSLFTIQSQPNPPTEGGALRPLRPELSPTRRPLVLGQSESTKPPKGRQSALTIKAKSHYGQFFISGLAALALALTLPFALLTVWAVLVFFLGWLYISKRRLPWLQIWLTLGVGFCSAPVIIYDYWISIANPILAGWSAQNVTAAPSIVNLLLGYGLVGLLAIVGSWLVVRRGQALEPGQWLVLGWAVIGLSLLYLPFDLQRRLITGLHIPLCILAALGLHGWLARSRLKLNQRRQITAIVITLGALGTLFVWSVPLLATVQSPHTSETTALLFIRNEEALAFAWLRENTTMDDIVLASPRVGMFIPGQTGARVFYGHPFETIQANQKKAMVEAFYRGEIEKVTPAVEFIFYGPAEKALGQPQNLAGRPAVFSVNELAIYKDQNGDE